MSDLDMREEHDLLGVKHVPKDAYYGVQTARALDNFNISGIELRLYPDLIVALAMVKLAAARANFDCGQFSRDILKGIEAACTEIMGGALHDHFRLDVFQGGAGTSTNMNANEVIANRALEAAVRCILLHLVRSDRFAVDGGDDAVGDLGAGRTAEQHRLAAAGLSVRVAVPSGRGAAGSYLRALGSRS